MPNVLQDYVFLQKLKQLPFVERIYLFGSRARGDHSPRSDIDLAISCPTASRKDWLDVLDIIDNADTLLKIDCIQLEETDDRFKAKILKEGIILYER